MSIIIPANSAVGGGFDVDNSVRYNGSSDSMNRTFAAGNQKTWTWSMWIKRSKLSVDQTLFGRMTSTGDAGWFNMSLNADDTITFGIYNTSYRKTNRVFRDTSAWYHIVLAFDTTQGTAANRIKFYINGVEETSFSTSNDPSQNFDGPFNANAVHSLGIQPIPGGYEKYYGGYISEVTFIDGAANAVTDFGEFDDSGIWKPISVSGLTFGTNGFYLPFTNSSALGEDYSGEDHDWTTVNLAAIDQSLDSCTNNFCTPNPLYPGSGVAFSEGNLKTVFTSYSQSPNGTIGAGAGKWYYEMKMSGTHARFGWCESHCPQGDLDSNSTFPAYAIYSNGSSSLGLRVYKNVTTKAITDNGGYTEWSAGNTVGIAFDIDNGKFYAHLNGTYYNSGDPANGTGALITGITAQAGGLFLPYLNCGTSSSRTFEWNFGSPSHAISSGNADGNGYGNFEYAVPSSYYAINSKNLAEYG
jgi:hypothetical protein